MKELTKLSLLGAMALLFVGCTREEQTAAVNPTYNPETNEVTTQFVLSVAPGNIPKTKMTADVVQLDGSFRGISAAHLLTFEFDNNNKKGNEFFLFNPAASAGSTRDYDLGTVATSTSLNPGPGTTENPEVSSRILELSLPLKTNAVLFYGLAYKPDQKANEADVDYFNKYGTLDATGTGFGGTLTDLKFTLKNRLSDATAFTRFGNLLARIMTSVVKTKCSLESYNSVNLDRRYAFWWPQDEDGKSLDTRENGLENGAIVGANGATQIKNGKTYTLHVGTASWADMGAVYALNHDANVNNNVDQSGLEEVLGEAYYQITTIQQDPNDATKTELRAGSAASILKTLRDLNDVLNRVINAEPTQEAEQVAIEVAKEIRYRMKQYFETTDSWKTINYKGMGQILTAASQYIPDYDKAVVGTDSNGKAFDNTYLPNGTTLKGGFPLNLGLPMSSALLTWYQDTDESIGWAFKYLDGVPAYGIGTGSLPTGNYRYPPELIYFGNSGLRVNDNPKEKNDYPSTVSGWSNSENSLWSGWTSNGSVLSTTSSVAVMKQVEYGTALMRTNLKYASLDGSVAYDNNANIHPGEQSKAITIGNDSFRVTGVFIGGVRESIGWDLTAYKDPTTNKLQQPEMMIYDRVSEDGISIPTSGSATFYTMTWDNYCPQLSNDGLTVIGPGREADQGPVYIAVELINNTGADIWGELNLIRSGGTFYLVAKLDPSASTTVDSIAFPEEKYVHYPPYYATGDNKGQTIQVKRVFMQDYVTDVTLSFTKESLQHAYVTVPDLRSSQISLGLSVDLTWRTGYAFQASL
jgi:hypothetical protein